MNETACWCRTYSRTADTHIWSKSICFKESVNSQPREFQIGNKSMHFWFEVSRPWKELATLSNQHKYVLGDISLMRYPRQVSVSKRGHGGKRAGIQFCAWSRSLMQRSFWKLDQEQRQSRRGRRLRVSHRDLCQTLVKSSSLHGQRRHHDNSLNSSAVLHIWERSAGGGGGWVSTYSTVYSECIVKCVCRQVLLNYIFVCKMETDVSFFYGGTTGSEQRNL